MLGKRAKWPQELSLIRGRDRRKEGSEGKKERRKEVKKEVKVKRK
jgi:hypothetical protein